MPTVEDYLRAREVGEGEVGPKVVSSSSDASVESYVDAQVGPKVDWGFQSSS